MPRFVLLEHTGHPEDPTGRHFDLLLEEPAACQTWRLAEIPVAGGRAVTAERLPPHRLAWLDTEAAEVSGGRGFARRVAGGRYEMLPPTSADEVLAMSVRLTGQTLTGRLRLSPTATGWAAALSTEAVDGG
jgi:hypothetical protein